MAMDKIEKANIDKALNAQDDAKKAARNQLIEGLEKETARVSGDETPEETADTPEESNEDESTQEEEPVETTTDESEESEEESEADAEEEPEEEVNEYKVLLEAEKARREKAEKKIVDLKREAKEGTEEEATIEETSAEREEAIYQAARKMLQEEIEASRKDEINDSIENTLDAMTDNESERELIQFHYSNTINHSGTSKSAIKRDLEMARVLANPKKLASENNELKEALRKKATTQSTPNFSGQPAKVKRGPKLSASDKVLLKGFGLTENDVAKKD